MSANTYALRLIGNKNVLLVWSWVFVWLKYLPVYIWHLLEKLNENIKYFTKKNNNSRWSSLNHLEKPFPYLILKRICTYFTLTVLHENSKILNYKSAMKKSSWFIRNQHRLHKKRTNSLIGFPDFNESSPVFQSCENIFCKMFDNAHSPLKNKINTVWTTKKLQQHR